jgi:hypothetical protein
MSGYQPPASMTSMVFGGAPAKNDLLDLGKSQAKKSGKSSMYSPDDVMVSLKSGSSKKYDDDDESEEIKESSSLLGSSTSNNVYQAKQNMQAKRDYKSDNISSADVEKNKSFFQKWMFDPLKYQVYFDTNTAEVQHKLVDAMWPFIPEN